MTMIKEETLSKNRAKVIETAIAIESMISTAIINHYFGEINLNFMLEVMFDEYFTSALKIRVLKKAFPHKVDNEKENKLRRIINIRNIFAHCNTRIYNGAKWVIINPKDYDKGFSKQKGYEGVDFDKLYEEFETLNREITEFIMTLIPQIRPSK